MIKIRIALSGLAIGIINAVFASGGGLIAVPILRSLGNSQKNAQASALAVILPLSFISAIIYCSKGYSTFSDSLPYIPFGFLGALTGTKLLNKVPDKILKKIFSVFILWAGIRMLTK